MEHTIIDSVRIIHVMIHMTGVITLSAYSAALISFLAVKVIVMPFTTMEGLLEEGTYRFSVVGESADYELFQVLILNLKSFTTYWNLNLISF